MNIFSRPGVRTVSQDAMADLGPGMHPRISIKGGRFTLIDAGGVKYPWPNLILPVIVVGANPKKSKVYYEGTFDPDANTPPTCYSDNGIGPSRDAFVKQARTCAECPLGAWGSDTSQMTGKLTKACNDKKKLAVIVIGDMAQLTYELQIPPATLKNLNKYAAFVGSSTTPDGARKADLCDIVTNISFMPDQVGILDFAAAAWIDSVGPDGLLYQGESPDGGAAIAARIDQVVDSGVVADLVGLNDVPWQAALEAPAPQAYLEPQPQGGALQRGSNPQAQLTGATPHIPGHVTQERAAVIGHAFTGPFAGPAGAQAVQPRPAFVGQPTSGQAPSAAGQAPSSVGTGRRGRPPKSALAPADNIHVMPPAGGHAAPGPAEEAIPPFLRRAVPADAIAGQAANEAAQANQQPTGPFTQPAVPSGEIQDAIKKAFTLNAKRP